MMKRLLVCLCLFFLLPITFAANSSHTSNAKIKRVLYITFDGTRWQDIFLDRSRLPKFWQKYASRAVMYGAPNSQSTMEVASIPLSLPSYHSQMTGVVQPCPGNDCGRMQMETFPEALVTKFGFNKKDVAAIASWEGIAIAAEHTLGTIVTNVGNMPMYDPDTHVADPVMEELNRLQEQDGSHGFTRLDGYTFAHAMHYYRYIKPRFMWISLNDSDEAAHNGDLNGYRKALSFFDDVLEVVMITLKELNVDKETLVIITTDHGRGNGDQWKTHGADLPESKQTWAIVFNGELKPISREGGISHYSTLSIRPTIEAALAV